MTSFDLLNKVMRRYDQAYIGHSTYQLVDDMAVYVGQPEVAPLVSVSQTFVVNT